MSRLRLLADEIYSHDKTRPDEFGTELDMTRGVMRKLGEQMAIDADQLAVCMISRGMLPSLGYRLGFDHDQRGGFLMYTIFPVDALGCQVSLSGGDSENRST